MEDNSNYTYTYEKESENVQEAKPERSLKTVFLIVIITLFVLVIVLGIYFGKKSANKEVATPNDAATSDVAVSTTTEPVTQASKYNTGLYSVNVSGASLLFRKDHSKSAETILEIADKTELTIEEIYHDETADYEDYEYWGKTTYKGHTGWVAMKYMQKAYSDSVVTPDDISSSESEAQSSEVILGTSQATTNEDGSSVSTTVQTSSTSADAENAKYTPGDYVVSTDGATINFRSGAGTSFDTIMSIADGEAVTVTAIEDTKSSNEDIRYWGKVTYNGHTGYLCMTYLEKAN